MTSNTPHLFPEMDPTCKFKMFLLDEDGMQCKKPCCQIGFFECQWIDNCIPCPLRWEHGGGGDEPIDPKIKIRIVDEAKYVVTTLASNHKIDIPEVVDIDDLLEATKIVEREIEGTETTMQTLDNIAAVLERIEFGRS